ncbi:M14 family zinc carboxypeptidase [Psychrosphaera aquimarina]|uniref:M14 family zinc carboxypeptidase n=1 Tax=Psychrosphaera aquimarina TaxID=2044854 RepID=A0ABU3R126_9GAMM|nr:M14 family zinc carboxypeptidase [Psychrosphaera aquimarina]MDU0113234.1 M14 family zinc carboxypeptidase [Psychrosphaera aquimarina]
MTNQLRVLFAIACIGFILVAANIDAKTSANVRYGKYLQPLLDKAEISPSDITPIIATLQNKEILKVEAIGHSFQGRKIHKISIGSGKTHVLIWSQMHGDEPTATASIFDVLNYITADENKTWRDNWSSKLTLHFVPMLNPDGAEQASRFNAQGIDINRDASQLQTPEGQLLHKLVSTIKPSFGFNLHDQSRNYAAGDSDKTATISVLAPSFNYAKEVNDVRLRAMQVIAETVSAIKPRLTGHIGRYDDSYSHRAFGDTLTRLGVSTVLIESGGFPSDDNRQIARKATYLMLIAGIDSVHNKTYLKFNQKDYDKIPMNVEGKIKDLLVNNITINVGEKPSYTTNFIIDLAVYGSGKAKIIEIGDASVYSSYHQLDASNYQYIKGEAYDLDKEGPLTLSDSVYFRILKQGITHFIGDATKLINSSSFPVVLNPTNTATEIPSLRQTATFLLSDGRGIKFAVLNGQVLDLRTGQLLNPIGT